MQGFAELLANVVQANGLCPSCILRNRTLLTLPGFFRPAKIWDLVVIYENELIAAIELKSHVGPSFSNNFNNRTEEAIGTAIDLWTAYREGAFGNQPRPFVGWLMLVEDTENSRVAGRDTSPHFPLFKEYRDTSYLVRYDLLCQKMIKEQLYTSTCVLACKRKPSGSSAFTSLSKMTSFKTFVASLAGHVATQAARLG